MVSLADCSLTRCSRRRQESRSERERGRKAGDTGHCCRSSFGPFSFRSADGQAERLELGVVLAPENDRSRERACTERLPGCRGGRGHTKSMGRFYCFSGMHACHTSVCLSVCLSVCRYVGLSLSLSLYSPSPSPTPPPPPPAIQQMKDSRILVILVRVRVISLSRIFCGV